MLENVHINCICGNKIINRPSSLQSYVESKYVSMDPQLDGMRLVIQKTFRFYISNNYNNMLTYIQLLK